MMIHLLLNEKSWNAIFITYALTFSLTLTLIYIAWRLKAKCCTLSIFSSLSSSYFFLYEYSTYRTHLLLLFLQTVEVLPFRAPGSFGYFSSKCFGNETIDDLFVSSLSSVAGAASKSGNATLCGILPIVIGIGSRSRSKPAPSGSA